MISKRTLKTWSLVIALAGIGAAVGIYMERYYQGDPATDYLEGIFWPEPKQLGPFGMTDHLAEPFDLERLKGQWTFMFFGFTSCPDVCPTTMAVLNEVARQLNSENIQVIFVTVDPDRDTIDKLATYTGHFNKAFIGLGGTIEQLNSLASQIGITYYYEDADDEGNYEVSHTSSIFLFDPEARLISMFSAPFRATEIASRFTQIKTFISSQD